MTVERRQTPLEDAPVFSQMTSEQRREINFAGSRRIVRRGKFFFQEGEVSAGLHVLLRGKLKSARFLPGGQEIVLHFVNQGEVFGELPALLGKPYPASALALE